MIKISICRDLIAYNFQSYLYLQNDSVKNEDCLRFVYLRTIVVISLSLVDIIDAFEKTKQCYGYIDIVANNAGVSAEGTCLRNA